MTGLGPHRVGRAVFALRFPDHGTAFGVRHELERALHDTLLPALERTLDAWEAPAGAICLLDRLEVDLGRVPLERFDRERVGELIGRSLSERLSALPSFEVRRQSSAEALAETLGFYLRTGRLPWPSVIDRLRDLRDALPSLPDEEAAHVVGHVRPLLARDAPARRLVYQFDPELVSWFMERLQPAAAAAVQALERRRGPGETAAEVRIELVRTLARHPPGVRAATLLRDIARLAPSLGTSDDVDRPDPRAADAPVDTTIEARPTPEDDPGGSADDDAAVPAEGEAVATPHAGIVLLHPFLDRLFRRLGLVDSEGRFVAPGARGRAVHLLHHLATGGEHPEEPDTALFKLLCGLPLAAPIPRERTIEAAERLECEALLAEAIGHWDRLGDASPQGLREAFVARDGILRPLDPGWRLSVEQRGVDVLLDALPWSIAVIRLPWMEGPLYVDWR